MMFYPKDSMIIGKVQNGWMLRVKGIREEQEDNLDGIYAFRSVKELCDWLVKKFPDSKIITQGSFPGPLFPGIDKRPWCPVCRTYPDMARISFLSGGRGCPTCDSLLEDYEP